MASITELTMAINTTFASILNEIQLSNLNFCIQMTPFAAYITLKKSVQKDMNGVPATPFPPVLVLLQQAQQEVQHLKNENFRLKSAAAALEKKCEDMTLTNASLVDSYGDITKDNETLTATKNILQDKIVVAEKKDANHQNEYSLLESRMKDMKRKHNEEIKDLKSHVKDLDKENKRKEKEIHNLSRNIENARSTIKNCKSEKSHLLISKSKLEAELKRLKKVQTTKKKEFLQPKSNSEDENANYYQNPDVLLEKPEILFLPSMVSHWSPRVIKMYQRPESTTSMIVHYKNGSKENEENKLISKEAFEELMEEFRAQLKTDRIKILAEIKKDFSWCKES